MNKTKLYDFSLFNNEYEILDLRLKYMKNFVDKFFVCEINITYQSSSSEFYSKNFIENYPIAKELISEGRLEFVSLELQPNVNYMEVERNHRTNFSGWVKENIKEDYVGIFSDCDEIVSEDVVNFIETVNQFESNSTIVRSLQMLMFYFAADNCSHEQQWGNPKIFHKRYLEGGDFQMLRDHDRTDIIPNMGWHFSSFGGIQQVIDKIQSFSHTEFNDKMHTTLDQMHERIRNRQDYLDRKHLPCKEWSLENYPESLKNILLEKPKIAKIENLLS
jgi:beta-1,4-mannosyl-glycoprotein beta-1,4-N-acetylglucosaminyltransferase